MAGIYNKGINGLVVSVVLAQSILISGCQSLTGALGLDSRLDRSDACYVHRVAVNDSGSLFTQDMISGALKGAAAGAAVGAGVALLTGNTNKLLVLTIGGLAAGAVVGGYWNTLVKDQGRDGAISSALVNVKQESDNLNKTQIALEGLLACRRQEVAAVKNDYRAGRITKAEGEAKLAAIRARMDVDYEMALEINKNVSRRGDEYKFALEQAHPQKRNPTEKEFAKETSSCLTRGQGVAKSADNIAAARLEAGGLEAATLPARSEMFSAG